MQFSYAESMEENLAQENLVDGSSNEEIALPGTPNESLMERLKLKIPSLSFVQTLLIPGVVIILIVLLGGGGTYLIASSVLNKTTPPVSTISSISQSDIPVAPTLAAASPTPFVPSPTPSVTPSLSITPTIAVSSAAGWTPYSFTTLFLNFSYPPGWFVNVGATSGPPFLTVQNYSGVTPVNIQNQYSILISRFPQVGITTVSALTTQLALNAASSLYINGVNMGQVTVISATPTTVNGYQALERTVTYSAFPTQNFFELYVLDGVSNAVEFMPQLDTTYGQPYFDTLVSTIQFTN